MDNLNIQWDDVLEGVYQVKKDKDPQKCHPSDPIRDHPLHQNIEARCKKNKFKEEMDKFIGVHCSIC